MTDLEQSIVSGLDAAMKRLQTDLPKEQKAQGHSLTGKSERSYEYEITVEAGKVRAVMINEDYVLALETGVRPENVRYPISVMIAYWARRGVTGREGISAAWATKRKHERVGIPTFESYRFSSTGERTGFMTTVIERDLELIGRILEEKTGLTLEIVIAPELDKIEPIRIFV